jgi:hypothetical protein
MKWATKGKVDEALMEAKQEARRHEAQEANPLTEVQEEEVQQKELTGVVQPQDEMLTALHSLPPGDAAVFFSGHQ